jgi:hypothetical protein
MIRPVDDDLSQGYGANPTRGNPHPDFGDYQPDGHSGEDYKCKAGTPVRAVTAGEVLHVGWYKGTYLNNPYWIQPGFAGWCYVVRHITWWGTFIGIYGHCMENGARVKAGDIVTEGQVLGLSGNTGASTGDHLHFEILIEPFLVNSYMYGRANPATLFGGLTYASESITILTEEIDVTAEANIIAKLDNVLARQNQIVEWQDANFREIRENDERNRNLLAAWVRDVVAAKDTITTEQIDAKFAELTATTKPDGQILFKGDADPTVYAWDASTGFRGISYNEYLTLTLAGAVLKELPQPIIDTAVGGK